jgi:hypothetical protein
MHETGMQEEIGHQLVKMTIIGHEKMKSADVFQIDSSQFQNKRGKEGDQINDQQILCDRGYAEHHVD